MCERFDALPRTGEVEMPRHRPWRDDAADASSHRGAEAVERIFKDDGFLRLHAEFFGGVKEERRIGLHLAGVIDGGDVVEVIVQAELVHPRVDPHARTAGGDGDAQTKRGGFLQKIRDSGKEV